MRQLICAPVGEIDRCFGSPIVCSTTLDHKAGAERLAAFSGQLQSCCGIRKSRCGLRSVMLEALPGALLTAAVITECHVLGKASAKVGKCFCGPFHAVAGLGVNVRHRGIVPVHATGRALSNPPAKFRELTQVVEPLLRRIQSRHGFIVSIVRHPQF